MTVTMKHWTDAPEILHGNGYQHVPAYAAVRTCAHYYLFVWEWLCIISAKTEKEKKLTDRYAGLSLTRIRRHRSTKQYSIFPYY